MDSTGQSELAAVGRAVRAAYVHEPAPDVAEGHIAAILAEAERVAAAGAHTAARPTPRPARMRASLAIRLAAVVASAFLASAGLAIAGVRPPEPFSDVFEGLGFDVPGSDNPGSDEGHPAKGESKTGDRFGSTPGGAAGDDSAPALEQDASDRRGRASGDAGAALIEEQAVEEVQSDSAAQDGPTDGEDHPGPIGSATQSPLAGGGPKADGDADGEALTVDAGDGGSSAGGNGSPGEPATPVPPVTPPTEAPGETGEGASVFGLSVSAENRPAEPPSPPDEPQTVDGVIVPTV